MASATTTTIAGLLNANGEEEEQQPWIDGSGNPLYEKYKNYGIIWVVIPPLTIATLANIIGVWSNLSVVYATWKTKSLHGICNYLLAASSFFNSFNIMSKFMNWYLLTTGINFIPLWLCVYFQTIPLIGLNSSVILIFFIGLDRVYSILLPGKYQNMNVSIYVGIIIIICLAYNGMLFYFIYDFRIKNPRRPALACSSPDAMPSTPGEIWFYCCAALNLSTMTCYAFVGFAIKFKTGISSATKKVYKTLFIITIVIFFGWTVNAIVRSTLTALKVKPEYFFIIGMYSGAFVSFAGASNYFVLYFTSIEYRTVFRSHLNAIFKNGFGLEWFAEKSISNISITKVTSTKA